MTRLWCSIVFVRICDSQKRIASEPDQHLSQSDIESNAVDRRSDIPLRSVPLLIFGGPVLRGFSFAFVVGIIVGTYSSIFIATPIVILANRMIADRKKASAAVTAAPTRGRAPAK